MRNVALKILEKADNGAYLNIAFKDEVFSASLSNLDIAFLKELVFGVFRNKILLDYIIRKNSFLRLKKIDHKILNILRMGVYQLLFMDKVPDHAAVSESVNLAKRNAGKKTVAFVNAVLRSVLRTNYDLSQTKDEAEYLSVKYSYPKDLTEFFMKSFGKRAKDLMEAGNTPPELCIRINTLKTTMEDFIKKLDELNIKYQKTPYTDCGLYLFGATEEKRNHLSGLFTLQDQSSQLAALSLDPHPGDFVIDLCAAPGGKTTHIAELMENRGTIYATDLYESRLRSVDLLANALGIDIIKTEARDATSKDDNLIGKADKILADVPCSGLGIIRRKPDIKYKENITDFKELNEIQLNILETAHSYLKSGGVMVYSTCTINKGENLDIINKFLKKHPDMSLDKIKSPHILGNAQTMGENGYIEIFPDTDKSDGFFVCRIKKL